MNKDQLLAILWLRWRLSANQFARGTKLSAVLSVILIVLGSAGALAMAAGGLLMGVFAGSRASPLQILGTWDVFIFVLFALWATGLLMQIQRSESIDLTHLLHLPINLRQVFLFNYLLSLVTPSLVLLGPGMLGFAIGLTIVLGPRLFLSVGLILGLIFMLTSWTYCLRGWLAGLMVNKRRRQSIMVWITVVFITLFQLPNIFMHLRPRQRPALQPPSTASTNQVPADSVPVETQARGQLPSNVLAAHIVIPPGWVGYGTMRLLEKDYGPALGAIAASALLGAWGLRRAYRNTLKFYQGGEETRPAHVQVERHKSKRLLVEYKLPFLTEETSALLLATLRATLRAPELKMVVVVPICFGAGGFSALTGSGKGVSSSLVHDIAASVAVMTGIFSFAGLKANMFGLDRGGFRTLVLLPTPRWRILLGKNLAMLPLCAFASAGLLVAATVLTHMNWGSILAGTIQFATGFCMFSLCCNWLALFFSYRMKPGSLQATKATAGVFLIGFGTLLVASAVLMLMLAPCLLKALLEHFGWRTGIPLTAALSLPIAAVCAMVYALLLPHQGRVLQKREQIILRQVTEEVE